MLFFERIEKNNWFLAEKRFDLAHQGKGESVLHLANGFLGIRSAFEEDYPGQTRGMFVAGTFNRCDEESTELPNAADLCAMEIILDDEPFCMTSGTLNAYLRTLNLYTGELRREVDWSAPSGKRYALCFRRFVSAAQHNTYGFSVEIHPLTSDVRVLVSTGINARTTNAGTQHFKDGKKRVFDRKHICLTQQTNQSNIYLANACSCTVRGDGDAQSEFAMERRKLRQSLRFTLSKGETAAIDKICVTCKGSSADVDDMMAQTIKLLKAQAEQGYEELYAKSREWYRDFWQHRDIRIEAENSDIELAIRYAQYALNAMMPPDSSNSIAAKGLSGEGYKGHVFWDTEIFLLPYFQHVQPDEARRLLQYRIDRMQQAAENARAHGYRGYMFPWESAQTGCDETPRYASMDIVTGKAAPVWSGEKEHHITADVALAAWRYAQASGDDEFLINGGAQLIVGCALFWSSRAVRNEKTGLYEILDIIGPDEYTEHVNNNAYTNYVVHETVLYAIRLLHEMTEERRLQLEKVLDASTLKETLQGFAERIYLPAAREDGVIPQDDSFLSKPVIDIEPYRLDNEKQTILQVFSRRQINDMQVLKQADLVLLTALFPGLFTPRVQAACWDYYEGKTIHDSSLSHAVYALAACGFGQCEKAYRSFVSAMEVDLGSNPESSDAGIHAGALGGMWLVLIGGFAGVRAQGDMLHIAPCLPLTIDSVTFPFCWHGVRITIEVTHHLVKMTADNAQTRIPVWIEGRQHYLHDELCIPLKQTPVCS